MSHVLAVESLAHHHRDPFDRLLIAQAGYEGFHFVSRDRYVVQYGLPHILA
jgi:PIN domain nuclease of toxin-antitoxin system